MPLKTLKQDRRWWIIILLGWAAIFAYSELLQIRQTGLELQRLEEQNRRDHAPATDWLRVDTLHVYDAWEGEAPYMHVDRTILRPFRGEWHATIRVVSDGTNSFACMAEGRAAYAIDARLPPNLTLDWWTWPEKCRPPPGRYRFDTTWTIRAPGYPEKEMTVRSNVFEVHPLTAAVKAQRARTP